MKKLIAIDALVTLLVAAFAFAGGAATKTTTIAVEGMTCGGCATAVKQVIRKVDGVAEASVSYGDKRAIVTYDPAKTTPSQIANAIVKTLPYKATVVDAGTPSRQAERPLTTPPVASPLPATVDVARVSFYEVGLVCPAAPKIGCGSRAKPVLLTLGADARIAGAWLNETGTRLAVAWKGKPLSKDELNAAIDATGVAANDIAADDRAGLVASFRSNRDWLDATTIDRLSVQEAGIIAARLVRRMEAKAKLSPEQAAHLRSAFEETFRDRFTRGVGADIGDALVAAAKPFVEPSTLAIVRDVVALGYRPLPHEE